MSTLTYQLQVNLPLPGVLDSFISPADTINQATAHLFRNVQELGTTEEMLMTGDITTPGVCVFFNLSGTRNIEIGSWSAGDGLPVNSKLRIAADGTPHLKNDSNGLYYPFRVDGPDGNVYFELNQTGVVLPITAGTFNPFLLVKPGEKQLCRVGVSTTNIYARAIGGNADLFYIIYDD